jgi:hypothetical protein
MSIKTNIAETLREARGEVDLITKLKEGSLEARRDRIAEALQDPDWDGAPADLVASYPHHVIARKEGILMRVPVSEDEGIISFGKADIYSVPTPVGDIGTEVMETAKLAVDFILKENFEAATPMIRGIVGALDVKGDLQRRLSMAVQLKSLGRKTWWQETISEQFAAEVEVPDHVQSDDALEMSEAVDSLRDLVKQGAAHAVNALKELHNEGNSNTGAIECANDIAEDLTSAMSILNSVDKNNLEEMCQVHEEVRQVVPRLLAGINFLTHLTRETAVTPDRSQ